MRKEITKVFLLLSAAFVSQLTLAQNATLSGKITNEANEPLIGAAVLITNAGGGAIANEKGEYTLTAKPGTYNLEYKYLGYLTQKSTVTLSAGEKAVVNVKLAEDQSKLKEVVAIGYGTKFKRDITGSIGTVKGKELADLPTPSFEAGLQGKLAGIQVTVGSGVAGSPSLIRIRGVASVSASGDPLYVIDGVPVNQDYFSRGNNGSMNQNPLATLNPLDIETINVLKDAAATAIYGARGSNGVILITTKTAKKEGWNFEFNTRVGTASPTFLPQMLDNKQFLQLYQEAWENDGKTGRAVLPGGIKWEDAEKTNTNWIDELVHVGFKQMYNFSTGYKDTANKWSAFMTMTHDNNGSYLVENKYVRNSARINADYEPLKGLKFTLNSSFSKGTNYRVYNGWSGGLGAAMSTALPIYPIYDSAGNYNSSNVNPVRVRDLLDWKTFENRSINSLNISYDITDKWNITAFGGFDYSHIFDDVYTPKELILSTHSGDANRFVANSTTQTYNVRSYYKLIEDKKNYLGILGGVERIKNRTENFNLFADSSTEAFYKNKSALAQADSGVITEQFWAINSAFARFDYSRKNKYLADFTIRTDGSSKFGPNNRYGFFPALGLGWVISEEDFMRRLPKVSFLKLKTGYGISGNVPTENNSWRQVFIGSTNNIKYNGNTTVYPTNQENPNLQWETSNILDISLEAGLFKNRLSFEIAFYDKTTKNILLQLATPSSTGFGSYWENTGTFRNWGTEFAFTSKNITTENFWWETQFNISRNFNKVIDLGIYFQDALSGGTNDTRVVVGQPLGTNYLVRYKGVDPANGRPVYLDKDGNETYTWRNDDRVAVGSVLPKAFGGFTNNFKYKNLYLSTNIYYSLGGNIYNSSAKRQNGVVTDWNMTTEYFDRWQEAGDDAKYPKLSQDETNEYGLPGDPYQYNTTLFIESASYVRLRNLTLSYAIPAKVFNNKIQSMNIGLGAFNVLTWTKFTGGDPEIARDFENPQDRNMSAGISYLTAPQEKSYTLSVNVKF
jgi:TonB-linked SusC/RagA family outer membrane protein